MTQALPTVETALMVIDGEAVAPPATLETRDPASWCACSGARQATSMLRCAPRGSRSRHGRRSPPASAEGRPAFAGLFFRRFRASHLRGAFAKSPALAGLFD
jgi:hypothetical protein